MDMKKGVIEVQFNWIFVLIVGAIILAFFVSIVMKQKDLSSGRLGTKLATDLETITTGAEVSVGTAQLIKVPNSLIEFQSPEDQLFRFVEANAHLSHHVAQAVVGGRVVGVLLHGLLIDRLGPFQVTGSIGASRSEEDLLQRGVGLERELV